MSGLLKKSQLWERTHVPKIGDLIILYRPGSFSMDSSFPETEIFISRDAITRLERCFRTPSLVMEGFGRHKPCSRLTSQS